MKIYFLNAIQSGLDLFELVRDRLPVAGYIGLSERWDSDRASGYVNAREHCTSAKVPYFEVDSYGMNKEADRELVLGLEIDVLVVAGWQRLIPSWLIDHVSQCCVGMHGSPLGITRGRGRSPQNWALILGLEHFEISIFKITPGIDSGEVIASRSFRLEPADDIRTSYIKVSFLVSQMMVDAHQHDLFRLPGTPQDESEAEYLPQRTPDDGLIDWGRSPQEIADFVRAQTRPYPGAFARLGDHKLVIWTATPFALEDSCSEFLDGEVIHYFSGGELLVKCRAGAVIVTDFETEGAPSSWRGVVLGGGSFEDQLAEIARRHLEKTPDHRLSSLLSSPRPD